MTVAGRRVARGAALVGIAGFAALLAWAWSQAPAGAGFGAVWARPWGRVTVLDLYLTLTAVGAWIGVRERSLAHGLGWTLALYLTGSLGVLGYALWATCR